jgi:hypothetical protein
MASQTLTRLKRCKVWAEESRSHGFVHLVAVRFLGVYREALPESELNDLLKSGAVRCDTSTRIFDSPVYASRRGAVEVTVKYWSVA